MMVVLMLMKVSIFLVCDSTFLQSLDLSSIGLLVLLLHIYGVINPVSDNINPDCLDYKSKISESTEDPT